MATAPDIEILACLFDRTHVPKKARVSSRVFEDQNFGCQKEELVETNNESTSKKRSQNVINIAFCETAKQHSYLTTLLFRHKNIEFYKRFLKKYLHTHTQLIATEILVWLYCTHQSFFSGLWGFLASTKPGMCLCNT